MRWGCRKPLTTILGAACSVFGAEFGLAVSLLKKGAEHPVGVPIY